MEIGDGSYRVTDLTPAKAMFLAEEREGRREGRNDKRKSSVSSELSLGVGDVKLGDPLQNVTNINLGLSL